MKVADIMQRQVETVRPDDNIREVSRLIFGRGVSGIPVVEGKKLVGIITEYDIFQKLYPSMQDVIEDYSTAHNFDAMEENVGSILKTKVADLMTRKIRTVKPDTPIMKAQSIMTINDFSRLPVVNDKDQLVGIISDGDIFRAVIGKRLPFEKEEGFYDWMATYYDTFINWEDRLSTEIPDLLGLFKQHKVKSVVNIGSSTGEHNIALAEHGIETWGLDVSRLIARVAQKKVDALSDRVKTHIHLLSGAYKTIIDQLPNDTIDAAIFTGNAFPHVIHTEPDILALITNKLSKRNGLLFFQIVNFEKLFNNGSSLREFTIKKLPHAFEDQIALLGFYTQIRKRKLATFDATAFQYMRGKWIFKGIHSAPIVYIGKEEITAMLKKLGYKHISFSGSPFYGPLFDRPFSPRDSDWLNVVATR